MDKIKDLGIIFYSNLNFHDHINEKINKAYSMLGLINRNFNNMSTDAFLIMYKSMVRSHLEYVNSVWNPYRKEYIHRFERVQLWFTKIKNLINITY